MLVPSRKLKHSVYGIKLTIQPKVGNIAINDAFMIESSIYYLLKKHFRQEKYYIDLIELFHETTFQTEIGQEQDLIQANEELDLNKHSMTKWAALRLAIVRYWS